MDHSLLILLQSFQYHMKKPVQLKTIMFILRNSEQPNNRPNSQSNKITNKMQYSPSQHIFKGSKIQNKPNQAKSFRKLSHQTPDRFKARKRQENYNDKLQESKCFSHTRNRYEPLGDFPEETILHSKSNIKLTPFQRNDSSFTNDTPHCRKFTTSINWSQITEIKKARMKSEPTNSASLKDQIMKRVSKKLDFMRKMTIEQKEPSLANNKGDTMPAEGSKLFNFDRLYEHCLKKINRGINIYQKDVGKDKDRKYYEMKIESTILSNELKTMRKSIIKRKQNDDNDLGVIGNFIDLSKIGDKGQRINSQRCSQRGSTSGCGSRANASGFKKKLGKITRNMQGKNPFKGELYGWENGCQKPEQFQI